MFQAGDYIHYSTSGLCCVEEITTLNMAGADDGRLYYRLTPVDGRKSTIYTPVDNRKVVMRPALTRDEAEDLIGRIPQIEALKVKDERGREQAYKDALGSADTALWVSVIKELYHRREERIRNGKKATATEEKYFRSAVELLHRELAQAVGIRMEEVEAYIAERVDDFRY